MLEQLLFSKMVLTKKKKSPKAQNGQGGNATAAAKGQGKMAMMQYIMESIMGGGDSWGDDWWGSGGSNDNNGGGSNNASNDWKSRLQIAIQKSKKHSGKASYEVNEVKTESGGTGYQAAVDVDGTSYCGEVAPGKKAAEHMAAKVALEDLFPHEAKGSKGNKAAASGKKQKGGKKKHTEDLDIRVQLNRAIQLLIPAKEGAHRLKGKDDMVYKTEQAEGNQYVSTLTIKVAGTFTGEACGSKQDAERSAATVAYDAVKGDVAPLLEENIAKRRKKFEESKALWDQKAAAKKAEKDSAKAA